MLELFCIVLGYLAGVWSYRYMLKSNPESLERLANSIKETSDKVKEKIHD